jgi:hypothetical protein
VFACFVDFQKAFDTVIQTGGACVLSVTRFQEGGRRSAGGSVPKLEYDILRRNASTNVRKTYLPIIGVFQLSALGKLFNSILDNRLDMFLEKTSNY